LSGRFDYLITQDDEEPVVPKEPGVIKRNRVSTVPKPGEFVIVPSNPDFISSVLSQNVPNVDTGIYVLRVPTGRHFVLDPTTDLGVYFATRNKKFVNGIITITAWDASQRSGDVVFREYSGIFDEDSEYYRPMAGRWMKRFVLTPGDVLKISLMAPEEIVPDDSELVLRVIPSIQTSQDGMVVGSTSGATAGISGVLTPFGFRRGF